MTLVKRKDENCLKVNFTNDGFSVLSSSSQLRLSALVTGVRIEKTSPHYHICTCTHHLIFFEKSLIGKVFLKANITIVRKPHHSIIFVRSTTCKSHILAKSLQKHTFHNSHSFVNWGGKLLVKVEKWGDLILWSSIYLLFYIFYFIVYGLLSS